MTSPSPIQSPSSHAGWQEEPEAAALFVKTLRALAEAQRQEEARQQPSVAVPAAQKQPLTSLGPLRRGPQGTAKGRPLQPAAAPARAEKPALVKKVTEPERAPAGTHSSLVDKPSLVRKPLAAERPAALQRVPSAREALAARKQRRPQKPPLWLQAWNWLKERNALSSKKQLRVSETVSLGEKRFVAVVHVQGQKFLIGGGTAGVSILAELDNQETVEGKALEQNPTPETERAPTLVQPLAVCAGGRSR
jgi:hypothetical protein